MMHCLGFPLSSLIPHIVIEFKSNPTIKSRIRTSARRQEHVAKGDQRVRNMAKVTKLTTNTNNNKLNQPPLAAAGWVTALAVARARHERRENSPTPPFYHLLSLSFPFPFLRRLSYTCGLPTFLLEKAICFP
jgi:hypothetical protein